MGVVTANVITLGVVRVGVVSGGRNMVLLLLKVTKRLLY